MLDSSGESGHPCLVPDFRGNAFSFSPLRVIFAVGLSYIAFIMLRYVPSIPAFCRDLNVRPETIKPLEENIGKTLSDINHSRILYDPHPRILETKAKINTWDLIKLKSFCTTKETISKVKRQPSDWEKVIANEATDKG